MSKIYLDKTLYCNGVIEIKGDFIYDEKKKVYTKDVNDSNSSEPDWLKYSQIEISISHENKNGLYKEYYKSGRLRRVVHFIMTYSQNDLYAHGSELIYYEDKDSEGKNTYTLLEENEYNNMQSIGISKRYSIDGVLIGEHFYDEVISFRDGICGMKYKEYHNSNGALALINEKTWGKSYYENGNLKADWENKDYRNDGGYKEYHENGLLKMEVHYKNGTRYGIMNKYFPDGNQKEIWTYNEKGERISIKKYYNNGILKSDWIYGNGELIKKIEYDKNGKEKV